jgi:hypothetical protein
MINFYITAFLFILFLGGLGMAIYVKLRDKSNTREQFAFYAVGGITSLGALAIKSIADHESIWSSMANLIRASSGRAPVYEQSPPWTDHALIVVILISCCYYVHSLFKNWAGTFSVQDQKLRNRNIDQSWVTVGIGDAYRRIARRPPPIVYIRDDPEYKPPPLAAPGSLAWHIQAKELYAVRHRSFHFDQDYGWNETRRCWIGEDKQTRHTIILVCTEEPPLTTELATLITFGEEVARGNAVEYYIAIKRGQASQDYGDLDDARMQFDTYDSLLTNLVDFRDYYADIRERVERRRLPDSDFSIKSVYVQSSIENEQRELIPEPLEEYLASWLNETGRRQLALLGEYGQGKSTGVLMFAYNVITGNRPMRRVPVIIELRGRSPHNHTPEDLLATWAHRYDLNPRAIMQLIIAGKILVVFEGFDEMAHATLYEERLEHFKVLWQFAYEDAKILFTGRPNLFLDDDEMRSALGIGPRGLGELEHGLSVGPHCEFVRLRPFTADQIQRSLNKWAPPDVVGGVVQLAEAGGQAAEIVSRPSLLYIVALLWRSAAFEKDVVEITSAKVIGQFILHSLRRQTQKSEEGLKFMSLTEFERLYFTEGIAAFMGKKDLTNQITRGEFREAVEKLVACFDPEISRMRTAQERVDVRPLPERMNELERPIETIETDVRAYGILVPDVSRSGAWQFAHKSFFEFLFARVCAFNFIEEQRAYWVSLIRATEVDVDPAKMSNETLGFLHKY